MPLSPKVGAMKLGWVCARGRRKASSSLSVKVPDAVWLSPHRPILSPGVWLWSGAVYAVTKLAGGSSAAGPERGALANARDLLAGQLNSVGWLDPLTRSSAMSGAARALSGQQAARSAAANRAKTSVKKCVR